MPAQTLNHVRKNLTKVWDAIEESGEPIIVKRRGHASLVILRADDLASLETAVHLLRTPRNAVRLVTALERALKSSPS
jgi:antitoxin YefM